MEITYLGHSAFVLKTAETTVVVDPYITGNEIAAPEALELAKTADVVVLTHGHSDHIGDTLEIVKHSNATVVGIFEVCMYLNARGVEKIEPMNIGGTVSINDFDFTMVNAVHSASMLDEKGDPVYMGSPAGIIFHCNGCTVYHTGDTDIFSDMKLINRLYTPHVGLIPIGGRFTMNPKTAAMAVNEFFDFSLVIPMHYDTFPVLTGQPEEFARMVTQAKVSAIKPGKTIDVSFHYREAEQDAKARQPGE